MYLSTKLLRTLAPEIILRTRNPKFDLAWYQARMIKDTITGCWVWQRSCTTRGYPQMWKLPSTDRYAHRHIWRLLNGEIPDKLEVMHKCDNPKCINPEHLEVGTHRDNMDDMVAKKRDRKASGAQSGKAKLTDAEVCAIRALPIGTNQQKIAQQYCVTPSTIWHIINNRTWKASA